MASDFVDLEKRLWHCSEKNGSSYYEMDGNTRIRSENV